MDKYLIIIEKIKEYQKKDIQRNFDLILIDLIDFYNQIKCIIQISLMTTH